MVNVCGNKAGEYKFKYLLAKQWNFPQNDNQYAEKGWRSKVRRSFWHTDVSHFYLTELSLSLWWQCGLCQGTETFFYLKKRKLYFNSTASASSLADSVCNFIFFIILSPFSFVLTLSRFLSDYYCVMSLYYIFRATTATAILLMRSACYLFLFEAINQLL